MVRDIVESRENKRNHSYPVEHLLLWEGYLDKDVTWEPWGHIQGTAEEVLAEFHYKYPDASTELDTYQSKGIQSKQIQSKRIQGKRVESKSVEGRQDRSTQVRRRHRVQTKQ